MEYPLQEEDFDYQGQKDERPAENPGQAPGMVKARSYPMNFTANL